MASVYRFGDLTLDTGRQELSRGEEPVHLGPLTYRLLLTLVEAAPNLVTYDELAAAVWRGRLVTQETIAQRMKLLRDAIGEDAQQPRYIELVRGRGFRLLVPVAATPAGAGSRDPGTAIARRNPLSRGRLVALVLLLVLGGTVAWWISRPDVPRTAEEPSYSRTRIAVLPFEDFSASGDQQFLADGIAETVQQALTRVEGLDVIARSSSFALRGKDIATVASDLQVGTVLEGSVQRVG